MSNYIILGEFDLNGLGRKEKNTTGKQTVFTKETFGVVLMLFSALSLVLVITRGAVFGDPGVYVNSFFFGAFGYFSFLVCAYVFYLGFFLLTEKRFSIPVKIKLLVTAFFSVLAVMLQIVSVKATGSYGEYIATSYSMGSGGIATSSISGAVASLLSYWEQKLLTPVGSYVVSGVLLAVIVFFFVRTVRENKPAVKGKDVGAFRSSYEKSAESTETADKTEPVQDGGRQKLFVANSDEFAFKSKKELEKSENAKIEFEKNGLGVVNYGTYKSGYTDDLQDKINYIKTPSVIDITPKTEVKSGAPSVSDYVKPLETKNKEIEDSPADIPLIEHGEERAEERESYTAFDEYANVEEIDDKNIATENDERFDPYHEFSKPEEVTPPVAEEDLKPEPTEEEEVPPTSNLNSRRLRNVFFGESEEEKESEEKPEGKASDRPFGETDALPQRRDRSFGFSFEEPSEEKAEEPSNEEEEKALLPENFNYDRPPLDLLETYAKSADAPKDNHEERMRLIKQTLDDFGVNVSVEGFVQGPSVTRYEIKMPPGVPVKKMLRFEDDFMYALASNYSVRVEAPIPGKSLVGIEVANTYPETVGLKEVLSAPKESKRGSLMFALGKDIVGEPIFDNLAEGPHFLVAGTTGSGKSVCLNVMIVSLIMRYGPEDVRLILVDPKGNEFRPYEHLPHLLVDEIVTEPKKALAVLSWAHDEMERRYKVLEKAGGIRDIKAYNEINSDPSRKMPRIVIVVDELSNLMETCKKEMEARILAIAQKSRAVGIHLVLATQRPSVDVITGTIKANLPSRIALRVTNFADSNTILGAGGADKLLGHGDMLYRNSLMPEAKRYQGAWISDMEINNVVRYIIEHNKSYFDDGLKLYLDNAVKPRDDAEAAEVPSGDENAEVNDFFLKALYLAVCTGTVSISQLQRRFSIGYARAGGLVDKMERMGFVSANEGSKARRVLLSREEFIARFGEMSDDV